MLEEKQVEAYVKYNYFHKEQRIKDNPFLVQSMFYNKEQDFYVCPMGQPMKKMGISKRISINGYESEQVHYMAKRCDQCSLRDMCHKAEGNRVIQVNHRLNELKRKAK